jgi:hypothetical protein
MAANYADACEAITQRFKDNWKVGADPITPVEYVNDSLPEPPVDPVSNKPVAWVFFEIVHNGSYVIGSGTPGQQTIVYDGFIKGHVFTPINTGTKDGLAMAVAIGEMFRNKVFYNDVTDGCYVRSGYDKDGQPRIDNGDVTSDNGQQFTTTATIPFEYWHLG